MPASRLQGAAISLRQYDIVGQDAETGEGFVRHVGLSNKDGDISPENPDIDLVHMGPPLAADSQRVDLVAQVDLTADEQYQIGVFVEERTGEYQAAKTRRKGQYVIHPHVRRPDRDTPFFRFSCAGFVIEAYRDAGVDLLVTGTEELPEISLGTLVEAYPDQAESLRRPRRRAAFGLEDEPPWRVVLAGYVINACNRRSDVIRADRYLPQPGDEFFPPKQPDARPD
jgi:hypothetical protein